MTKVVSLYLPRWATDRYIRASAGGTHPADEPLVLAGNDGRRRIIMAANKAALGRALHPGMPLAKAQVLVPGLRIQEADPAGDFDALERLAFWSLRYSPVVAADAPDGVVIDIEGAAHLLGGEDALARDLHQRMTNVGYDCRIAVADTWGAAHAIARYGRSEVVVVETGRLRAAIERLPIPSLRLEPRTVDGLRSMGFATIADVLIQPRAPLTLRFGPQLWRRIDQALGATPEPIDPVRPADIVEVRQAFAEPIGAAETIKRYIGKLVDRLCEDLERRGLGARRLDLMCQRVDAVQQAVRVGTASPTRDRKRLVRMLSDKVQELDPGFGIETMALAATWAQPASPAQSISSLVDWPTPDVSDLVDVLANRIGGERLYRMTPVSSDVPERSAERIPAMAPESKDSWTGRWPRPSRLLARPEPIETVALLPDHPPASFTWRGIRRRVKRADGPERVFGEWWTRDAETNAVRDYFRVEDESGERFWVYRAGDGLDPETGSHRWFLHGIFG